MKNLGKGCPSWVLNDGVVPASSDAMDFDTKYFAKGLVTPRRNYWPGSHVSSVNALERHSSMRREWLDP